MPREPPTFLPGEECGVKLRCPRVRAYEALVNQTMEFEFVDRYH